MADRPVQSSTVRLRHINIRHSRKPQLALLASQSSVCAGAHRDRNRDMDPAIRTSLLCRSLIGKVGEATVRCEYSARLVFRPCWGEGRLWCFATVFVFTKAPNVDRKTSEMKGATVKDADTEASLVRIPMTLTVITPYKALSWLNDHTHTLTHTLSVELLRTSDQPHAENILPASTLHSHTLNKRQDIHAPGGGIRTCNISKRTSK